jgi:oligoendopeptidase F
VAIVDEFQHWIYENPSESIDARDQAWMRIWKKYKPSISFGDREDLAPMRWYQQGHIFGAPFYYIDYAIAEIGALQLGMKYQKDSKSTITTYIDLCRWGGTKSVLEIFKDAGLDSPFEPQTMSGLMQHARKELGL